MRDKPKEKVRALRSLIFAAYDTEADMARAIGWPRQKLNKITSGVKEPSILELSQIATGLSVSIDELAEIFLRYKSPNEQQNGQAS